MSSASLTTLEMLERLVAFDTTSSRSNLDLVDFVCSYLDDLGVRTELTTNDEKTKANVWATLGPEEHPGIVLSGHTDVVPVTGQPWTTAPFHLTAKDGRLYGRGAADMKGFIAIALVELAELVDRSLDVPVHLALSYDEEIGCHGARRLIAALPKDRPLPELVIVGEPTGLDVVHAHKGLRGFETRIEGRAAHSSLPELGLSAVQVGARIVGFLEQLAAERREQPEDRLGFEPPYTTMNVGRIEGGTAMNIIPRECRLVWEYRPLPGEDPEEIRQRVERFVAETFPPDSDGLPAVRTRPLAEVPAFPPSEGSPAVHFAQSVLGGSELRTVSYTSEAGLFQEAGIPAVVCGPGHIAQAHQPNEYLSREQLRRGTDFVRAALARVLSR